MKVAHREVDVSARGWKRHHKSKVFFVTRRNMHTRIVIDIVEVAQILVNGDATRADLDIGCCWRSESRG